MTQKYIETTRIRQDGYYDIQCPQCNKWFEAQRSTATFCNSTCRSKWSRSAEKRQEQIDRATSEVKRLIENMPWRSESPEFLALQSLTTLIKSALANVES